MKFKEVCKAVYNLGKEGKVVFFKDLSTEINPWEEDALWEAYLEGQDGDDFEAGDGFNSDKTWNLNPEDVRSIRLLYKDGTVVSPDGTIVAGYFQGDWMVYGLLYPRSFIDRLKALKEAAEL